MRNLKPDHKMSLFYPQEYLPKPLHLCLNSGYNHPLHKSQRIFVLKYFYFESNRDIAEKYGYTEREAKI